MLHIAVCDDSVPQAQALASLLQRILRDKPYEIFLYHKADALMRSIQTARPDILFLDIVLGVDNGIQVASDIKRNYPDTQIVFTTAYPSFAADIYDVDHTYFLLKPVKADKLEASLARAMDNICTLRNSRLALSLLGGTTRIFQIQNLVYFERTYRTTSIVSTGEIFKAPYKLVELEALLPENVFARPHNSFLVQLGHVLSVERAVVHLDNGCCIPISNQKRAAFHSALIAYL
jgi:DNA-binding LytR/AlgR family response regulator